MTKTTHSRQTMTTTNSNADGRSPYLLRCALSGETPPVDPVVTPSGHICSRRLLLAKLTDNGGVDPFDSGNNATTDPRPLDESDLIELRVGTKAEPSPSPSSSSAAALLAAAPPRLPSSTSFPAILAQLQKEHDALVLELFDTRRALEETRRELSQALYQNDASVRVVARLVMERDGAREQLAAAVASAGAAGTGASAADAEQADGTRKRARENDAEDAMDIDDNGSRGAGGAKNPALPKDADIGGDSTSKIPQADLDEMVALWKALSKTRKKAKKSKEGGSVPAAAEAPADNSAAAAVAVTIEAVQKLAETSKKSLHKSSSKPGVLGVAYTAPSGLLLTTGRDRQTIVYDIEQKKVVTALVGEKGVDLCCADILTVGAASASGDSGSVLVATGAADGIVRLYAAPSKSGDFSPSGTVKIVGGASGIAGISIHPSGKYILAATKSGKVAFLALREGGVLVQVALLGQSGGAATEYTCGALHPDGLIYEAGTSDGSIVIWDLKSQTVAGTLKAHGEASITSLDISDNGYHFASSTSSGTVQVWDLRKLKCVATLNSEGRDTGPVHSVAFSPNGGKILGYVGAGGTITFVPVKDWENRKVLVTEEPKKGEAPGVTGVAWLGGPSLVTCSNAERPVRFWTLPEETE